MKHLIRLSFSLLLILCLAACGKHASATPAVVCTNFAAYDFARQIAGDNAEVSMLLKPGTESHSYEPSPRDVIDIQNCSLFVCAGGVSDVWADDLLDGLDDAPTVFRMTDCVKTVTEETVQGMEPDSDGDSPELDEHVWTSPKNAREIVKQLCTALCEVDPAHETTYRANADRYAARLRDLDARLREMIAESARTEIVVADRFPFRYLCRDYGLTYWAAFPGCSDQTEPSAATVAFLIDKVQADGIPVVFQTELSSGQLCTAICEATGARAETLNALHNVSEADFSAGVTYLDLMTQNIQALKEALN